LTFQHFVNENLAGIIGGRKLLFQLAGFL